MQALEIMSSIVSDAWGFFYNLTAPALNVPFSAWFFAGILIQISFAAVRYTFGIGDDGAHYRSGSSRKVKISDKRKGDEL